LGIVLLLLQVPWGTTLADEEPEPQIEGSLEMVTEVEEGLELPPAGSPKVTAVTDPEPGEAILSRPWGVMRLLDCEVAPGERRRLFLHASESFAGDSVEIPVLAIRGERAGPVVCMTAGVHGDELNGIEIVRQIFEHVSPKQLSGMLVGVPVANLHGFRRGSRYLPDRRDLNRYFPGHPAGSSASRIASALFDGVVCRCDALVDFHTGSFYRTNLPHLRANLMDPRVLELAQAFGIGVVVHSEGMIGTLRRASTDAGIPAITYEAGEPKRFQGREIDRGVEGMRSMLRRMGVLDGDAPAPSQQRLYYPSRWVRVNDGGIFITYRELGERIASGDVLGTVTDPVSNERSRLIAPVSGRILGMAVSQVVIPGFAAFHIGIGTAPLEDVGAAVPGGEMEAVEPIPLRLDAGATLTPGQLEAEEHPE
jgi:predicted deacylase